MELRALRTLPSMLLVVACLSAQIQPSQALRQVYVAREQSAPPKIKRDLANLRQTLKVKKLGFEVGYTSALDVSLEKLAGTRLPSNIAEIARNQNGVARGLLQASGPRATVPNSCSVTSHAFSWRDSGKISSVRDQQSCGSCWAFAAIASFESSYLIKNPDSPDASEQQALDCSNGGSCTGGWYGPVFEWMRTAGDTRRSVVSYVAAQNPCNNKATVYYKSLVWGFVTDNGSVPTVEQMKRVICEHGAVAVTVNATPLFQAYTSGVFDETDPGPINHAVVIVGWDDSKQAWLLKNSWGQWGIDGYMWIKYNSNSVGYAAAWVDAGTPVSVAGPKAQPFLCRTFGWWCS